MIKYNGWEIYMDFDLEVFFKWAVSFFVSFIIGIIVISYFSSGDVECVYPNVSKVDSYSIFNYSIYSKINWRSDDKIFQTLDLEEFNDQLSKFGNICEGFDYDN